MCDDEIHHSKASSHTRAVSRRAFGLSAAAAAAWPQLSATMAHAAGARSRRRTSTSRRPTALPTRRSSIPGQGQVAGRADLDRHRRPAPGLPRHGPPAGRPGLCGAGAQPLLPRADARRRSPKASTSPSPTTAPKFMTLAGGDHRPGRGGERRAGLPRLPRRPAADRQEEEGRDPGLLHGRPAGLPHRRGPARPHRRRASPATAAAWSPRRRPARTC